MGPIEILVISFPDAGLIASMGPLLDEVVASGNVRIVDAIVVTLDADGEVVVADIDDGAIPAWSLISDDPQPLISADDAALAAEDIEEGGAAFLFVIEHLWPQKIAQLATDSGGVLQLHARIDKETAEAAASVGA